MSAEIVRLPSADNDTAPVDFANLAEKSSHTFRFPFVIDGTETKDAKIEWTVKDLLIAGGMSVIYGGPKSGKTFLAQDAAYRIAHGLEFFGHKTKKGLVVYICGEGSVGFRQRMIAWRNVNGMGPTRNFVMLPAAINLVDDKSALEALVCDLKALAKELDQPIQMFVVDTLARSFGGADENSACDMNKFVNSIGFIQDQLARALNLKPHAMIVHHAGKQAGAGMRGSNALLGAADCAIEVTNDEATGIRQARVADIKDAAGGDPFFYKLKGARVGTDDDGDSMFSCAVDPTVMDMPFPTEPETKPKATRGRRKKASA